MAALPFKVKAVFNYDSKHEDDLNFTNGQIITVTDEEDDDWYYGEFPDSGGETQQGLFPRNFVERYEPTTPPRPSRSLRPKREPETEQEPEPDIEPEPEPGPGPELVGDGAVERDQPPSGAAQFEQENLEPTREVLEFGKEAGLDKAAIEVEPVVPIQSGISAEQAPREEQESQVSPRSPTQASKPPAPLAIATTKGPPPAIATKPTSSSFRDRIAAFNKPAAPPIQPIKPGQSSASSFVKKPYVAAPPSRDAYVRPPPEVPPAKQVKTQEESNIRGIPAKEEPRAPASSSHVDNTEDQPKPTSLKERIALLQKQQLEQAARHVEAAQKKEKPKKPPKKKSETSAEVPAAGEEVPLDRTTTGSTVPDSELDVPVASRPLQVRSKSKDGTPVSSSNPPLQELLSDPNDADQSAGGDTEDSEALATTKRVNKASASGQLPLAPGQYTSPPLRELDEYELEADEQEKQGNNDERDGAQKDEENDDEEEDIDPDVKRRMEIRDRMAKMSGGIGMAGMFGVPSGLPSTGAKKAKTNSGASKKQSLDVEASSSASPPFQPVPVMALPGMSMPGPSQVRTPEPMEDPMDSVSNTSQPEAAPIAMPSVQQSTHQEDVVAEQKLKDRNRSYPSPNISVSFVCVLYLYVRLTIIQIAFRLAHLLHLVESLQFLKQENPSLRPLLRVSVLLQDDWNQSLAKFHQRDLPKRFHQFQIAHRIPDQSLMMSFRLCPKNQRTSTLRTAHLQLVEKPPSFLPLQLQLDRLSIESIDLQCHLRPQSPLLAHEVHQTWKGGQAELPLQYPA